jgi:hypothetical protein
MISARKMHHEIENTMPYSPNNKMPLTLLSVECLFKVWPKPKLNNT